MSAKPDSWLASYDAQLPPVEAYDEGRAEREAIRAERPLEERDESATVRSDGGDRGARRLTRIDFVDIKPQLATSYTVKQLIKPTTLVGINGASGSGKTFFALDLVMHVTAGRAWRGHRVRKGLACYGALEGSGSAQNRVVAWSRRHLAPQETLPLCLCPGPLNLRNAVDVLAAIEFVKDAEVQYGEKCVIFVVDTLSRAMAGGKENHPEDMTALIAGADTIKDGTGAAVVLVHHLGKDQERGGRGHSSLKGALDTEIEIRRDGDERIATVTKQRDLVEGATYGFTLDVVELGLDDEGDPVTSCVVKPADKKPETRRRPAGKNQDALLSAVQEWQRVNSLNEIGDREMREIAKGQGLDRRRLREAVSGLAKFGWVETTTGGYRLLPEQPHDRR